MQAEHILQKKRRLQIRKMVRRLRKCFYSHVLLGHHRDGIIQKAGKFLRKMLVCFCAQCWQKERVFVASSV